MWRNSAAWTTDAQPCQVIHRDGFCPGRAQWNRGKEVKSHFFCRWLGFGLQSGESVAVISGLCFPRVTYTSYHGMRKQGLRLHKVVMAKKGGF